MVCLTDYDCLGFDLDHTIIQYKLSNLFTLVHRITAEYLVKKKGYDPILLRDDYELMKDFCLRGLVYDADKGNILKLAGDGYILRASHGTRHLSGKEIQECYGKKRIWPLFDSMKSNVLGISDHYRLCETFFDVPLLPLLARAVDVTEKEKKSPELYSKILKDIISGVIEHFSPHNFAAGTGKFFPALREETKKYVKPCAQELVDWLLSLRSAGKQVFLLTNSYIDYTTLLLDFAVGKDWKKLFNVVICMGRKPAFFNSAQAGQTPFYTVEGDKETNATHKLEENKTYSQGNYSDFMKFLSQVTAKPNPRVLYFGDSLRADIFPTHEFTSWDPVSVLEEMECEGMVAIDWVKHEDIENGPKKKKAKHLEFDVEEGKEEVLMSTQWGSMFTDLEVEIPGGGTEGPPEDVRGTSDSCSGTDGKAGHKTVVELLRVEADKEDIILGELNTLWGELIRKCSSIAIPRIDFITALPRDHEFQTFNTHHHGFYPGIPKSLHIPSSFVGLMTS